MVKEKTLFLCITGIIFLFLMQGWSYAYTFSTNSVGSLSTVKITDMSGSLSSSGAAITLSAWDASGNALTQSTSATPLMLHSYGTTSIAGTDLAARFPTGTPILYSFTINSSMTIIANVKKSEDGLLNFPITFTNGLSNFAINTVGALSTLKITDMSGSLATSGTAITVSAYDASGNALSQSASAAPLKLYSYGTTTIAGIDLAARFPTGTPMTYQFAVASSKYIFTNVKKSADGTINVPIVFTSGTTNYSTNSVGSLSTLKITDMSGSLFSSGADITVSAWDASGNALTQSGTAAPLTLANHGTTTITGSALAARFPGGTPMTYEFIVGSSQYIMTNVKGSTDGSINIPTVFRSGTNNFAANSVNPGDTIKISDLNGSLGSSGAAITVSAWDASGNALTQSGSASPFVLSSYGTTTIKGSELAARFSGGTPAAYEFSVASPNYLITAVKSTAGGSLNIPNVVYNGSTQGSLGYFLLKNVGLYVQFEERGWPNGYYSGDMLRRFNDYDSVVGSTVSVEIGLQLDKMKAMGVNTITFQLRSADDSEATTQTFPSCLVHKALGPLFPQPTATEMANLLLFFDMVQNKGMKVWLSLINMHMEELPRTNSETWLGAILGAIGDHPALDLVLFDGSTRVVGETCGIQAEAPLWLGPGSIPAVYVQWAIGFAISQGIPARKLSAEAIIGNYFLESMPPAGPTATDNHLWSPIAVEKIIFDNLNIPASDRTYALSFYEHRKCSTAGGLTCTDLNPHDWADQTLQYVTGVVGSGPRIVVPEMGDMQPVDQVNWKTQHALESIVFLMQKYGIDGGSFWRWVNFQDSEETDTTLADPVKRRGVSYIYNPVQKEIVSMGGFHVPVANGSFEGETVSGVPTNWTAAGNGTVSQYLLTLETGQPEVPSRGTHAMRIITGTGSNDNITATSIMIPVIAATAYTTTANMRFAWTGDTNPTGLSESRPQVFINVLYLQANGTPSAVRTNDSFSFFQEDSTNKFDTFPQQYTTPGDAAFVEIQFGAMRNGLPTQIILYVDNVR